MRNTRVYVRAIDDSGRTVAQAGQRLRWRCRHLVLVKDSGTIYFNEGIRATNEVLALDVEHGAVHPLTSERASVSAARDD